MAFISLAACTGPDATFTVSVTEGNAPLELQFDPVSTSDGVTYTWDFGDGNGSAEAAPTHVYETAGEFRVRLTVTQGGRSSSSQAPISVSAGEAGWVVVTNDSTDLVAGQSIQLTAEAFDSLGNPVPDAEISWEADPDAGTITDDGIFTAAAVSGFFREAVTASFERLDAVGFGVLAVSIEPGPIAAIRLEPAELDLIVGQRILLSASVTDAVGTPIPGARISFSAVRPGDSTTSGGELTVGSQMTGGRAELVRVTATFGADTYSASFLGTVHPGVLDEVLITPALVELGINERISLTAAGRDRFGNPVALDEVEYSLMDDGVGEITDAGVFIASNRTTNLRDSAIEVKGWSNGVWRKAQVPLSVVPGPVATLDILPVDDSVPMGAGSPMLAIVRDEFGNEITNVEIRWGANAGGTITNDGTFVAGFEAGDFEHAVIATIPAGAAGNSEAVETTTSINVRPRSADMMAVDIVVDDDSDIAIIDLRTSSVRVLNDLPGGGFANESGAAWYPDGSRLAFASDVSGISQVYDYNMETGEVRQLTDDPEGAAMPAISPDGTKLAYVSTRNDRYWQIFVATIPVGPPGEDLIKIAPDTAIKISVDDEVQNLLPFWSPDGTRIAYTSSRTVSDNDVRTVAADGGGETTVISGHGYAGLGWSDDGEQIYATITGGALTGLLVSLEVATAEITEAMPIHVRAFSASWAPDGSEAAIVDRFTGDLWLADTDGTGLRLSLSGTLTPRRVAWRPVPITGAMP